MDFETLRVGNAAGMIKTLEQVQTYSRSAANEITVGSITVKEQAGNRKDFGFGRVYYFHPVEKWSLNALGMPNMGLAKLLTVLGEMARIAHAAGKKLRVSVAGYSPVEYALLAEECYKAGADEVELNLGCPNVWGANGAQKPIPSYDPLLVREILSQVREATKGREVGVKISPVNDLQILQPLLYYIKDSKVVSHVVATNTIPLVERMGEDGHPGLSFENGNHKGGEAGETLRQRSVNIGRQVRGFLPNLIEYIGVGGIFTGADAKEYLDIGASGFQCGTSFYEEGGKIFSDIFSELSALEAA